MSMMRIPLTSPAEREQHKIRRRFAGWRRLIQKSDKILRRSERALVVAEKVVKVLLENPKYAEMFRAQEGNAA